MVFDPYTDRRRRWQSGSARARAEPSVSDDGLPSDVNASSGGIAQLVEHLLCKQGVRGSSPLVSTADRPPIGRSRGDCGSRAASGGRGAMVPRRRDSGVVRRVGSSPRLDRTGPGDASSGCGCVERVAFPGTGRHARESARCRPRRGTHVPTRLVRVRMPARGDARSRDLGRAGVGGRVDAHPLADARRPRGSRCRSSRPPAPSATPVAPVTRLAAAVESGSLVASWRPGAGDIGFTAEATADGTTKRVETDGDHGVVPRHPAGSGRPHLGHGARRRAATPQPVLTTFTMPAAIAPVTGARLRATAAGLVVAWRPPADLAPGEPVPGRARRGRRRIALAAGRGEPGDLRRADVRPSLLRDASPS